MTDTEEDIIELMDFDYEVPCDSYDDDGSACANPAEWRIILSCCGRVALMCDPHYQGILDWIGTARFRDTAPVGCGAITDNPFSYVGKIEL